MDESAKQFALDSYLAFPKIKANNAYRRAVQQAVRGGSVDTRMFEVVLLEDTPEKVVHAVVERAVANVGDVGLSEKDAKVTTLYKVGFDKKAYRGGEPDAEKLLQIETDGTGHLIAERIREMYRELAIVYRPDDVRIAFQTAFALWGGMRMIGSGGTWWIPPTRANEIRAWQSFMLQIYGAGSVFVVPQYDAEETISALREASDFDMEARLVKIEDELEAFSSRDNVRVSSLESRLEDFARLRDVVDLHDDLLGMRRDALREKLVTAEKSLCETLEQLKAAK